VIKRLVDYI